MADVKFTKDEVKALVGRAPIPEALASFIENPSVSGTLQLRATVPASAKNNLPAVPLVVNVTLEG